MPTKDIVFNEPKIHKQSPSVVRKKKFAIRLPKPKDKRSYRMPESKILSTSFKMSDALNGYENMMLRHGVSHHLRRKIREQTF